MRTRIGEHCDQSAGDVRPAMGGQMEHGGDIYTNQNIELDFSVNLSPPGPPETVMRALQEMMSTAPGRQFLSQYPDPQCRELREALAQNRGIPKEWILCGNGASELLMAAVQALRPERAMIPVPTYQGYERALMAVGTEIVRHRLNREDGYALTDRMIADLKKPADQISRTGPSILFLCNPNNPVGNCIEPVLLQQIAEHCRESGIILIVDECYLDLLPDGRSRSMVRELAGNPDLVIINAFTKTYAMPGIRLGYLMTSNGRLMEKIRLQLPEWSVSMIAQRAGIAALGDREYPAGAAEAVRREREYVCRRLRALGAEVFGGEAPFILFNTAEELYEPLKAQGILIRKCNGMPGFEESEGNFYRVGIRTRVENEHLLARIEKLLRAE